MGLIAVSGIIGAVIGYVGLAQQRLQPHQSRLRWVPALIVARDGRGLLKLLGAVLLGAVLGALTGWLLFALVESVRR